MSKIKRIAALLLALAMVLGMSITTFADVTGTTITVKNVDAGSTVTYEQIIVPAPGEETGWAFAKKADGTESEAVGHFKNAIKAGAGNQEKSDQQIIAGLILFANGENAKLPEDLKSNAAEIGATLLQSAFNTAALTKTDAVKKENGDYEITASSAGVYVIHATDVIVKGDSENPDKITQQITYSPMAAYVAFNYIGEGENAGAASSLQPVTVNAKKQDLTLTKKDDETDKVTAVNDVVTYTLNTTVPYIPDDVTNVYFNIKDMIKGAQYVSNDIEVANGPAPAGMKVAEKVGDAVTVKVKLDNGEVETRTATLVAVPEGADYTYAFSLDLKDIAGAVDTATGRRVNANKALEITYKAYVTSTVVDNKAQTEVKTTNDQEIPTAGPEDEDKLYTGSLKITKKNADNENETLADAKFVLYYEANGTKYYALTRAVTDADADAKASGVDYIVTGWSTEKPDKEEDDVLLITKADGTVSVKGLEDDTDRAYFFEEVAAPDGYSLNSTPAAIKNWENGRGDATTADQRIGSTDIADTRLNSLPSTGGIGTTIFTIGGCLIMIIAAGLFFATRKKSAK